MSGSNQISSLIIIATPPLLYLLMDELKFDVAIPGIILLTNHFKLYSLFYMSGLCNYVIRYYVRGAGVV